MVTLRLADLPCRFRWPTKLSSGHLWQIRLVDLDGWHSCLLATRGDRKAGELHSIAGRTEIFCHHDFSEAVCRPLSGLVHLNDRHSELLAAYGDLQAGPVHARQEEFDPLAAHEAGHQSLRLLPPHIFLKE
jgi:hypothetical protein